MPRLATGDSLVLDLSPNATGLRRLTREGGMYARWRNATTVELVSANRYITYDASRGTSDTTVIAFDIPRERARGSVALVGARIITLDQRRVIEQGTIVVRDGRIACVGSCDTTGVDRRINMAGKTITPGWVDVHAHHTGIEVDGIIPEHRSQSARYLAWGVTTTHDPASRSIPALRSRR